LAPNQKALVVDIIIYIDRDTMCFFVVYDHEHAIVSTLNVEGNKRASGRRKRRIPPKKSSLVDTAAGVRDPNPLH